MLNRFTGLGPYVYRDVLLHRKSFVEHVGYLVGVFWAGGACASCQSLRIRTQDRLW